MAELKPCPFCGGKAKFVLTFTAGGLEYGYVRCAKKYPNCCVYQNKERKLNDAIEAWNRRAEDVIYKTAD